MQNVKTGMGDFKNNNAVNQFPNIILQQLLNSSMNRWLWILHVGGVGKGRGKDVVNVQYDQ